MADRVQWGKNRDKDFLDFMWIEMERVIQLRRDLDTKWIEWEELYRAQQFKSVKQFPYPGANNIVYPYAMMSLNPIWANTLQTIHATPNIWTVTPLNENWVDVSKPLQDFLQFIDRHMLHMWSVNNSVVLEAYKLGTGIYKTFWRHQQNRVTGYDENLTRQRLIRLINQPAVEHVSLPNFFIPPEAREIDPDLPGGAQWVSERKRFRPSVLRAMARGQEPLLPNFDPAAVTEVLKWQEQSPTEHEQIERKVSNQGTSFSNADERPIELFEIHARFPTRSTDQVEDDVVCLVHLPSRQMLRALYNPSPSGRRPYDAIHYLRTNGFYGIGVCEQAEVWQKSISTMLNTAMDKAELTNAPMIGYKEGANILPNEPIYPTKQWALEDPTKDLVPFFLTDNRGGFDFFQLIQLLNESGNQHTLVSDLKRGSIDRLPSRTPATSVQSLLGESKNLFDFSIKDLRLEGLNEVGSKVLQLLQQHIGNPVIDPHSGERFVALATAVLGDRSGGFTAQALKIPAQDIATGVAVELTATTGANNKEVLQSKFLGILQLYSQTAPLLVQLMTLAEQPQGSPTSQIAMGAVQGMAELFTRLLEQHDIRNPEEIIPKQALDELVKAQAQAGQASPAQLPVAGGGGQFGLGG